MTMPQPPPGEPATLTLQTLEVREGVRVPGHQITERTFVTDAGATVMLAEPAVRRWGPTGGLLEARRSDWRIDNQQGDRLIRAADPEAMVDLAVMGSPSKAELTATPDRMTIVGAFETLGSIEELGRFVVGCSVLDTNVFAGQRRPSEQVALSLYRVARLRGGPLWHAVAEWLADWTRRRVDEAPNGLPVHGGYGHDETHMRFLADATLLLLAHSAWRGGGPYHATAERALAAVESLAVPYAGGRWLLHDSAERDAGRNTLVLNTHVQAMLALHAGRRDVAPYSRALDAALRLRPPIAPGLASAAPAACAAVLRGRGRNRLQRLGESAWWRAERSRGRLRERRPHLMSHGLGYIPRDTTAAVIPHYMTVNLYDLAGLHANWASAESARALRRGLRFATRTGFFRAQTRIGDPTVVLIPPLLRMAGAAAGAEGWATTLAANGVAPTVGWPGLTDHLWPALTAGTP